MPNYVTKEDRWVLDIEPACFVIPGSENARDNGAMDAWAWQRGEFSEPVYSQSALRAAYDIGRRSIRPGDCVVDGDTVGTDGITTGPAEDCG